MKDLLHYEEWKDKGIELNSESNDVISVEKINVYWQNPTKDQKEVYKYLKHKFECDEEPTRAEIFQIYMEYAAYKDSMRFTDNPELDDERIHGNAQAWFKNTISSLVFLGWFGLQFKKRL